MTELINIIELNRGMPERVRSFVSKEKAKEVFVSILENNLGYEIDYDSKSYYWDRGHYDDLNGIDVYVVSSILTDSQLQLI